LSCKKDNNIFIFALKQNLPAEYVFAKDLAAAIKKPPALLYEESRQSFGPLTAIK